MKLPHYLTRVTPFSKTLAFILFITLPIFGFLLGIQYQKMVEPSFVNISNITQNNSQQNNIDYLSNFVTKNWYTFRNDTFGFEFKYPRELKYEDRTGENNDPAEIPLIVYLTHVKANNGYLITVEKRMCNTVSAKRSPIEIAGKKGIRFIDEGYMNGYFFSNDNIEVELEPKTCLNILKYAQEKGRSFNEKKDRPILDELAASNREVYNHILSTFKFTASATTESSKNWKTYSNSQMGFSIRYPSSFNIDSEENGSIFFKEASKPNRILHVATTKNPRNGESRTEENPFGPPITTVQDSFLGAENIQSFFLQGYPAAKATYGTISNQPEIDKQDIDMHILEKDTLWQIEILNNETQAQVDESNKILSTFKFL